MNEHMVIGGEGGGVAASDDGGRTWQGYETGLPEDYSTVLAISESSSSILHLGCGSVVYHRSSV